MTSPTPPHSLEAEAAVLGALLAGAPAHEAVAMLRPRDFYRAANRVLFDAVRYLVREGHAVDPHAVYERLRRTRDADAVGGFDALVGLVGGVIPSVANVKHHAAVVAEMSQRRRTIAAVQALTAAAHDTSMDVRKATEETITTLLTEDSSDGGLITVEQMRQEILETIAGGRPPGRSTGWADVDRLYTVVPGYLTVVTGVPGHGKTTFVDALMVNLARADWRFAIFSPESAPAHHHAVKLMHSYLGGAPEFGLFDQERVDDALAWTANRFVWLDDLRDNTLGGIVARARLAIRRHGVTGIVIDPWNKIAHDWGTFRREDLYIAHALSALGRFARREQVHVWVVAHPTKLRKKEGTDTCYEVPTPYDISGGAQWNNMADAIVAVWRDRAGEKRAPHHVDVHVQKVREEGWWGKPGVARLKFDAESRRYVEGHVRVGEDLI